MQLMPVAFHAQAMANISRMAPGGTLLVIAKARDEADGPVDGPPWPLTRAAEVEAFAGEGLTTVWIEAVLRPGTPARWWAEFRPPPACSMAGAGNIA